MIHEISFTFIQALQMVALAPCVLVIFHLIFASRDKKLAIIPILYFLSLSTGIVYILLSAFLDYGNYKDLKAILLMGDIFIPALSFLLIFQFILNRIPPIWYWSVLTVPSIATGPFIFASVDSEILCLSIDICFSSSAALSLNNIFISSFIFILLVMIVARRSPEIVGTSELRKYKYWLIISLIIYNVGLLLLELGLVAELVVITKYTLAKTLIKLAFIYMVMTSIFRVFTDLFDIKTIHLRKTELTKYEQELAKKIRNLFENEKIYHQVDFNRTKLSNILGIGEHLLSRIINIEFKKSFSDVTNEYRVKEAKILLKDSQTPITSISFDVGFNSIASFNRVFKKTTGKSPTLYRDDINKEVI